MPVTIDPNIKKIRIFLDKNGNKISEDQLFNNNKMGNVVGTTAGANSSEQSDEKPA